MKNIFLFSTIIMIAFNIFLLKTSVKQRAELVAETNKLSTSMASESIAWNFVDNAVQYNDFELFNPENKQFLDLERNITPLIVINGKQCQPCIDILLKNLLFLEDSLEIISEIRFVFILDSAENSNNVNFFGDYLQKTYFIDEKQLATEIERSQMPGVFLIMADYLGSIRTFCEYDVNFSNKFVKNLIKLNEKYYKTSISSICLQDQTMENNSL
ncbi:MAG: hypothetical protein WD607_00880 [Candidatus Paceibacterota bacterium]